MYSNIQSISLLHTFCLSSLYSPVCCQCSVQFSVCVVWVGATSATHKLYTNDMNDKNIMEFVDKNAILQSFETGLRCHICYVCISLLLPYLLSAYANSSHHIHLSTWITLIIYRTIMCSCLFYCVLIGFS